MALDFAPDAQLNNPDLASIHVICAPWSSAQWSINWQDLVFWGKQRPDAGVLRHSLDRSQSAPGSNLSRNLSAMFEVRTPARFQDYEFVDPFPIGTSPAGNDLLTPPSFLMCPPGSAMNGVEVIHRCQVDAAPCPVNQTVIRGVRRINCLELPYDASAGSAEFDRTTSPLFTEDYLYDHGDGRMQIEQRVGITDPTGIQDVGCLNGGFGDDCATELKCPPGEVIGGFRTDDTSTLATEAFQILCVPAPQIGGTSTARFGPLGDTYVLKNRSENFGTESGMLIGGSHDARSLLQLDLGAVEQAIGAGEITRVMLEFSVAVDADEEISVKLHQMTQAWTELGATWDCASLEPDGSCSATWNLFEHPGQGDGVGHGRDQNFGPNPWVEEPTATVVVDGASQSSFLVDVTADVEAMIADGTNYGWILISDSRPNVDTKLMTRESGEGAQLIVEFEPLLPEPTLELSPADVFLQVSDSLSFTSPEPTTSWFVNGVEGGNAVIGFVSSSGVYSAPPAPPTPATVKVAALTTSGAVADAQVTIARRTVDPSLGEARHTFYGADTLDGTGDGVVAPRNSVASGDLDADGIDDIIIGVPGSDGFNNARTNAGEVAIYFGSSSLGATVDMRTQSPNIVIWGAGIADRPLGSAMAIADIDGDGYDDLILSEVAAGQNSSGLVHVFFGPFEASQSIDLLTDSADLTILPPVGGDAFGWRLAAGDVDGDGIADLVAEARLRDGPNGRADAGAVYVISGGPTLKTVGLLDLGVQPPRSTIFLPPIDATQPTGAPALALAFAKRLEGAPLSVGDLTGNGIADIVVGRNSAEAFGGPAMAGSVLVLFGGPQLAPVIDLGTTSADATFYGASMLDMLGVSTVVSDVTGDGFGDLIATAPGLDGVGRTNAGGAWVVPGPVVAGTFELGGAGSGTGAIRVVGPRTEGFAGYSVAVAQLDSDPHVEIALAGCISFTGAAGACGPMSEREFAGEVYAFDLSTAASMVDLRATPMDLVTFGADPFDRFGASLYRADTDGFVPDELVVGAPDADGPAGLRQSAGEVLVISGAP